MIYFTNKSVIDTNFIRSFAVSAKENEKPIGFFGTGMKYALAILLRHGAKVSLRTGSDFYEFETKLVTMRGKEFAFVTMNDEQLPFTIDLGKQWEMWMAFRELYCNALDEGGSFSFTDDPEAGTSFCVEHELFEKIAKNHQAYFYSPDPVSKVSPYFSLLPFNQAQPNGIFQRGIFIGNMRTSSKWTYDFSALTLTEDRQYSAFYQVTTHIVYGYLQCKDADLLRDVLTQPQNSLERSLDFAIGERPCDTFLEVVSSLMETHYHDIVPSAIEACLRYIKPEIRPYQLTPVQAKMLQKATDFVHSFGHDLSPYPIKIVENLGQNVLAEARDETIYLSRRLFEQGTKQVTSTLLEEFLHLRFKYRDCTRELQTYLFDQVISLKEEMNGEPL